MNLPITVNQQELLEILLNIAPVRPVYIWGAPGIGKSALVEEFAMEVGLECVSLLGSQLAPEDIIGIPQIRGETSEFLPPKMIARKEPYVLFLDELNACSQEVQKAFYSLIYERRIGEYHLPEGSIVIGAGNRTQDAAIVKTMSSALINRMFHVQLKPDVKSWLTWAYGNGIHPWVTDYLNQRPDHLFSEPPKTEEPFSTPRSWHMLSDALKEFGAGEKDIPIETIRMLAYGSISASHAGMFAAFVKQLDNKYLLEDIIKGDARWPEKPEDRDVLYFLAQSFRARLLHDLPEVKSEIDKKTQFFAHRGKSLLKELAQINYELAQMVVFTEDGKTLPQWFMIEIARDIPRLVAQEKGNGGKTA
ncbi:AAA family ATPase [Butyrivibrio sp. LC3010]|uniref:AAA family ATPase n=2 Tax=unclassified Butyrivibrio TaxID=2639466 RepID=UPI00040474B2|nr:AAA family ATPase [Butyrivibrio sp. LC3010]